MECLPNDDKGRLLEMVRSFAYQPKVCTCNDRRSYVIEISPSAVMGLREVRCEAIVVDPSTLGYHRHFMGHDTYCACDAHDHGTVFTVRFTMQQWATLGDFVDKVILLHVTTTGNVIDATGNHSAVLHYRETIPDSEDRTLRMGELFCGGYGGWSHAVKAIQSRGCDMTTSWALDYDFMCCKAFAYTHDMSHFASDPVQCGNDIQTADDANLIPSIVFNTDVDMLWWITYASMFSCQCIAWSPPCPPWSGANEALGLSRSEGLTMIFAALCFAALSPRMWMMENVSGLVRHKHWEIVKAVFQWSGYRIMWHPVLNLHDHVPQSRERLLVVAANTRDHRLHPHNFVSWPVTSRVNLAEYGALMPLDEYWQDHATLSQEELETYMSPRFLPKVANPNHAKRTKHDVVSYRLRTDQQSIACVLTTHGMPGNVPQHLAETNGIYGSLLLQGDTVRRFTTPELVILMGTIFPTWIPKERMRS